ncbi:MAG TPA: four helix bundle protein [Cyclobacteriaceae bacterium]|nr:four helix bundle protein [Cyclobacteriaceae bacterium]
MTAMLTVGGFFGGSFEKPKITSMEKGRILDMSFNFALDIIELYKVMIESHEYVISKQLLRSSASVGANVEEANAGISKREFAVKMGIASKEARESRYWLRLLNKSQLVKGDYSKKLSDVEHMINVLTKIVKTSQQSLSKHT